MSVGLRHHVSYAQVQFRNGMFKQSAVTLADLNSFLSPLDFFPIAHENRFCLCWGFTAQSTQLGHVERGQFTYPHIYWASLVL